MGNEPNKCDGKCRGTDGKCCKGKEKCECKSKDKKNKGKKNLVKKPCLYLDRDGLGVHAQQLPAFLVIDKVVDKGLRVVLVGSC